MWRHLAPALLVAALPAAAQRNAAPEISHLVHAFLAAEQAYDAATLATLVSDRFVEVSPAGEIDGHDRFLAFYTPDKKTDWPPYTLHEEPVRVFGDTAVDIVTSRYSMPAPDGNTRAMEIRSTFVAQRSGDTWKLIQTQHTGVRPAPPAAK